MPPTGHQVPRLGRYQLLQRLAIGGTAEVLLAEVPGAPANVRRFAIKRLLPNLAADAEAARMFKNEGQLTARFDHPNIVRVIEIATDPPYLVMELIEGLDLRTLMARFHERGQRVSAGLAASVMIQVLDALAYVHGMKGSDGASIGVVHRDLSPQNVVVSLGGVAKLIDFGIVQAQTNEGDTKTGELKGNLAYMAPEQISGRVIDGRADLFAVGVTLYELVTGVHPFRKANELATFNAILDEQPGPMSRWLRDCPPELEEAVRGALAKQREGRYRNAGEMRAMLERVPGLVDRTEIARVVLSLSQGQFARSFTEPESDAGGDSTLTELPPRIQSEISTIDPADLADTYRPDTASTLLPWGGDGAFDDETLADTRRLRGSSDSTEASVDHDTAIDAAVPMPEPNARPAETLRQIKGKPVPPGARARGPVREIARPKPELPVVRGSPSRSPDATEAELAPGDARKPNWALVALGVSIVFTIVALLLVLRTR